MTKHVFVGQEGVPAWSQKPEDYYISSSAELVQFIQCPGDKLLCIGSIAASVSRRPSHYCACADHPLRAFTTGWPTVDRSDVPLILVPATAHISLSCTGHLITPRHAKSAMEELHFWAYTRRRDRQRIAWYRLGMLAVRARDIGRDAHVLPRGGSKEGNEGRGQLGPRKQRLEGKWWLRA